jgi:hypothetical protein
MPLVEIVPAHAALLRRMHEAKWKRVPGKQLRP